MTILLGLLILCFAYYLMTLFFQLYKLEVRMAESVRRLEEYCLRHYGESAEDEFDLAG